MKVLQVSAVHVYLTYPFVLSWSMLEAMSAGCLLIASDTAPVQEIITDGKNGYLVDFFDHHQHTSRIDAALTDTAISMQMRTEARQKIVNEYDLESVCLPKMLEKLLNKSPFLKTIEASDQR